LRCLTIRARPFDKDIGTAEALGKYAGAGRRVSPMHDASAAREGFRFLVRNPIRHQ
jgi:hypothetical protein